MKKTKRAAWLPKLLITILALWVIWSAMQLPALAGVREVMLDAYTQYIKPVLPEVPNASTAQPAVRGELRGPYAVLRVVDGDTAMIEIDGEEKRVRFIGLDTPESVNPDESKNTPEGKVASNFTKELLTGKSVYLEFDIEKEDKYGRTLAYLYLEDGVTMVQEEILRAGYAMVMTIQPNSKYADRLHAAQIEARENNAGFWETGFFAG